MFRRRSWCWVVSSVRASPTVEPFTWTVSCFPVYCRRGVGMRILGINQVFLFRRRLLRVGQPAIGVVELSLLNRYHDKRVPRAGVLQIRLREIRAAIGMRVVDADEIEPSPPRFLIGGQQI